MIRHHDVIVVSSIEWDFLWQGPQEIATRLAQCGNRVLYIENTGIRSPRLRDARRIAHRAMSWARHLSTQGLRTSQIIFTFARQLFYHPQASAGSGTLIGGFSCQ